MAMSMTAASPAAGDMVVSSTTSHLPAAGHDDDDEDVREEEDVMEYAAAASSSSAGQHHRMSQHHLQQQQHVCRQDSPPDIDSTTSDHPVHETVPVSFSSSSSLSSSSSVSSNEPPVHHQQEHQVSGISSFSAGLPPQQAQQQPLAPFYEQQSHDPQSSDNLSADQIYQLEQSSSQYESNSSSQLYLSSNHHLHHHVHVHHPHQSNCHLQHHNSQHIIRMFHHMDPQQGDASPGAGPSVMALHEPGHIPLHPDPEVVHHSVWQPQLSSGQQQQTAASFSSSSEDLQLHEHYSELQQVLSRTSRSHSQDDDVGEQLIDHRSHHHHSHQYMLSAQDAGEDIVSHQDLHPAGVAILGPQHSHQQPPDDEEEEEQEIVISDVPVESRARASLPSAYLFIDLVLEDDVSNFNRDLMQTVTYGVYARKTIPERTQFGPVEGVISQISGNMFKNYMYNQHSQQNLIVFISDCLILDQSDENKSNWMRFVRAADSPATQNLILVTKEQTQANPDNSQELITTTKFYFMTTKCINPREELRVWYSKDYADRFRLKLLHESEDLGIGSADMQSASPDLRFNPNTNSAFFRSSSSAPPSISACDPLSLQPAVQMPVQLHSASHSIQHQLHEPLQHPIPLQASETSPSFSHNPVIRTPHATESSQPMDQSLPLDLNVVHTPSSASSQVPVLSSTPPGSFNSSSVSISVSDAKALSPIPPLSSVCDQLTISSIAPAHPDPLLPPASGHKLRNKIAKSQHQQQQLQLAQLQKQVNPEDAGKKDEESAIPSKSSKPALQHKCDICGKTFPRCYSLRRHQIMHSGEKKYKCPICSMSFSHVYNRNRHVKRHANRSNGLMRRAAVTPRENQDNRQDSECGPALGEAANDSLTDISVTSSDVSDKKENESQNTQGHDRGEAQSTKAQSSSTPFSQATTAPAKPFRCAQCYKCFSTDERLTKHALVHTGDDLKKPLACNICLKRFLNNSALSCHLKVHSVPRDQPKMYDCVLCKEEFECTQSRKEHVTTHADPVTGKFSCTHCKKKFDEFAAVRKHIRAFHSDKQYPCSICQKIFPRPDKLKLHMLRHSDHREFLCQSCGKQFKRKDKLKEHIQRMHAPDREARLAAKKAASHTQAAIRTQSSFQPLNHSSDSNCSSSFESGKKSFTPKVSPSDYHRFIYKCHSCLLGFKRRGMLVNHLAKRHPELPPDAVPELNLPILKTTRDYYCQYCDKIYKSSSKRKAHILKNHPGKSLPMSNRHKGGVPTIPGIPNPTYSAPVGSITTHPHYCDWCHKQYASKAKLLQHQRKKHPDRLPDSKSSVIKENSHLCGNNNENDHNGNAGPIMSAESHPANSHVQSQSYEMMPGMQMGGGAALHVQSPGGSGAVLHNSNSSLITILGSLGLNTFSSIISNPVHGSVDASATGGAADLHELLQSNQSAANDLLTQAMSELTGTQHQSNHRQNSEEQQLPDGLKNDGVGSGRQPQPLIVHVNESELWT